MNNQFDELTKSLAQSGTRRAVRKKFGACLGFIGLARLGLPILALIVVTFRTQVYGQGGIPLWTNTYNVPANRTSASAIAVDSSGNVFVSGVAPKTPGGLLDYVTIGYSGSGVPLWTNRYDGPGSNEDFVRAIAVDKDGNVIVTGYASEASSPGFGWHYATVKYSNGGV